MINIKNGNIIIGHCIVWAMLNVPHTSRLQLSNDLDLLGPVENISNNIFSIKNMLSIPQKD